jgi:UDPglucose--hexose-1-phosphate uridylyltransferase
MSELRLNPLTGRWVTIATERAARPDEFPSTRLEVEAGPSRPCPFCPGHEEDTPPALETYGSDSAWQVRVVPNRYPAFSGTSPLTVTNLGPLFRKAEASGIHEVLVLTPDHGDSFADLSDEQVAMAMHAVRDRLAAHATMPEVRYSQAIVNYGREAGASIRHPHGQLLGIPFVPGEVADEEAGFRRFSSSCALCTLIEAEVDAGYRIVHDDDTCLVVCPFRSGTPYEMLVLPKVHEGHLARADDDTLAGTGRSLRDALASMRKQVGDLAYNLVVHTLPHQHDTLFHWHVHVVPRVASVVGFEQGTGVLINIVAPESAADLLAY